MNSNSILELSLESLDQLSPSKTWSLGDYVSAACLLEAAAPKAGNVHPSARFDDMDYEDFRVSARVVGNVFDRSSDQSIGELVKSAVIATQTHVGKNTNLGILLLVGPLAVASKKVDAYDGPTYFDRLQSALVAELQSLRSGDSCAIYQAIAIANPGGMGQVDEMDVRQQPPADLLSAMRLAASRDDIAKQYVSGFSDVFELAVKIDDYRHARRFGWFNTLVQVQLERLASYPDSLIARKCDHEIVERVQTLAKSALIASTLDDDKAQNTAWLQFDDFLRADGHRRNPGTTADLLAAAAFVALVNRG